MNLGNILVKFIGKDHGNNLNNIYKYLFYISKYYSIIGIVVFIPYFFLVNYWYFEQDLSSYCIHVPTSEYHHIKISENNSCLIDWMFFLKEPILLLAIIYAVLLLPINIIYFFLKKKMKNY